MIQILVLFNTSKWHSESKHNIHVLINYHLQSFVLLIDFLKIVIAKLNKEIKLVSC